MPPAHGLINFRAKAGCRLAADFSHGREMRNFRLNGRIAGKGAHDPLPSPLEWFNLPGADFCRG